MNYMAETLKLGLYGWNVVQVRKCSEHLSLLTGKQKLLLCGNTTVGLLTAGRVSGRYGNE